MKATSSINEPIQVSTRFNYFPKTFLWRGKQHFIRSVDRCWTVSRRQLLNRVERHCFRVRTADATYEMHQDPRRDRWFLDRVLAE